MADLIYNLYSMASVGNIFLILVLLYIFVQDYRKVPSRFSLGLVVFAMILLLNVVFSCSPILNFLIGQSHICIYNTYHAIAAIAEFFALLVLIYLVSR